jgi:hypothetical protein
MSLFDEREKAFEAKFQQDEELAFKVTARRDKLLGRWVAEMLGLSGADAERYALSIVASDVTDANHHAMLQKLHEDLSTAGKDIASGDLQVEMDRLLDVAKQQLMSETDL